MFESVDYTCFLQREHRRPVTRKRMQVTKYMEMKSTRAALWDSSFFPVAALSKVVFLCCTNIFSPFSLLSSPREACISTAVLVVSKHV